MQVEVDVKRRALQRCGDAKERHRLIDIFAAQLTLQAGTFALSILFPVALHVQTRDASVDQAVAQHQLIALRCHIGVHLTEVLTEEPTDFTAQLHRRPAGEGNFVTGKRIPRRFAAACDIGHRPLRVEIEIAEVRQPWTVVVHVQRAVNLFAFRLDLHALTPLRGAYRQVIPYLSPQRQRRCRQDDFMREAESGHFAVAAFTITAALRGFIRRQQTEPAFAIERRQV